MTPNPDQCSDSINVDDTALQNYDNSGLPHPWHKTPALRLTWELFAGQKLSIVELDWLCALQYNLREHGFNNYTYKDHAIEYQIDSVTAAKKQHGKLIKLAIEIGVVKPIDIRKGRKSPRYLELTPHFVQFDWKGAFAMAKVTIEQQRQQRKRDADARDMAVFICELEANKKAVPKSETVEAVSERETEQYPIGRPCSTQKGDCAVPKKETASAEIPCNNKAESDSLELSKNYLRTTEELKGLKEVSRPWIREGGSLGEASRTTANSPDQRVLDQVVELEQKSWDSTWRDVDQNEKWTRLQQQLQEQSFSNKPRKLDPGENVFFHIERQLVAQNVGISPYFCELAAVFERRSGNGGFKIELNEIWECCSPGVLLATDAAAIYKAAGWSMPDQEWLDRYLKICEQDKQAFRPEENDFALEPAGAGGTSSEVEENTPAGSNVVPDEAVWASDLAEQLFAR
ncbi:hypothetical protein N8483_00075 [Synechococcus sp. AH-601-O20]|nr:hypothetical protein [Synechococcus sp. AH-601-O20]